MAVSGQVRRGKRGLSAMANDICTCKRTRIQLCAASQFPNCSTPLSFLFLFFLFLFLFLLLLFFPVVVVVVLVLHCSSCCYLQSTGRRPPVAPAAHNLYVVTKEEFNANYKRLTSQLAQGVCLVGAWGWYYSWLYWNPSCLQYLGPPLFPRIVIRLVRKPLEHIPIQNSSPSQHPLLFAARHGSQICITHCLITDDLS